MVQDLEGFLRDLERAAFVVLTHGVVQAIVLNIRPRETQDIRNPHASEIKRKEPEVAGVGVGGIGELGFFELFHFLDSQADFNALRELDLDAVFAKRGLILGDDSVFAGMGIDRPDGNQVVHDGAFTQGSFFIGFEVAQVDLEAFQQANGDIGKGDIRIIQKLPEMLDPGLV